MIETQNSILRLRSRLMVSEAEPSKLNPSTPLRIDGERSRTIKTKKQGLKFSIYLIAISVLLCLTPSLTYARGWKESGSGHFIIYFVGDEKFAKEVLDKAEVYYQNIAADLGYPRYSEFWMWNDRVKIYVYPDHASYLKATGAEEWTEGIAEYKKRRIISYKWSENFVESLLPHEMAHLIFRDFVGLKGKIPLWLDEGVAQWAEEAKREEMKQMAKKYYMQSQFLLLDDMMNLDFKLINDMSDKLELLLRPTLDTDGKEAVLIVTADELITTYYLQGVSLVGFLIERYGSSRFAHFCRQLRDGKSLEEALRFAYPTAMRSLGELEYKWRKYLAEL